MSRVWCNGFKRWTLAVLGLLVLSGGLPLRSAQAGYVGVDGFYGAFGIEGALTDLSPDLHRRLDVQHGGGGRVNFGIGKKWITEFFGGVFYGLQLKKVPGTAEGDSIIDSIVLGERRQEPQLFFTFGVEGRYYLFGESAYDPETPNNLFFGLGGEWVAPSFWEGSDYFIAVPSMKFISGYSVRLAPRVFLDTALEVFVIPTPPSNILNLRLGCKYVF